MIKSKTIIKYYPIINKPVKTKKKGLALLLIVNPNISVGGTFRAPVNPQWQEAK